MIPTFLALVGFFSVLGISERFKTPTKTAVVVSVDSLQYVEEFESDSLVSVQDTFPQIAEIDTSLFARQISDSARLADSLQGWIPANPARHPCKVGSVWMLCPDRPLSILPTAAPVQLARLEVSEPERLTTCYVGVSCLP